MNKIVANFHKIRLITTQSSHTVQLWIYIFAVSVMLEQFVKYANQ